MSKRFSKPPSRSERNPEHPSARPAARPAERRTEALGKPRGQSKHADTRSKHADTPPKHADTKPFALKSPDAKPAFAKPARVGSFYSKPRDSASVPENQPPREAKPRERRMREGHGQNAGGTWLWGWHAVLAALRNPERKPIRLVATQDAAAELEDKMEGMDLPLPPSIQSKDDLDRLLPSSAVHQGLALLTKPLPAVMVDDVVAATEHSQRAVVLILDQVTDPHNIGAVLRSAAAFGAAAVILPDRNAPEVSGTLAKSASGAVEHVPLVRAVNLTRAMEQLKSAGYWCIGLAGEAESPLSSHKLDGKVCLVLGSEGDGLRRLTREACDLMARLPTQGPVASLNVSNAAAIALYEYVRSGTNM